MAWILIHIEIQERSLRGFSRRMYIVGYRIFDRFDRHAVSLALHTGRGSWRSRPYDFRRWGFRLQLCYPVATLAPFRADRSALETSDNPVAVLVLAHLASQERGSPEARYHEKLRLMGMVHRRKGRRRLSKNGIMQVRCFMDWFLPLPDRWERRLARELESRYGGQHMAFMTIWERDGHKKGRKEGLAIGFVRGRKQGIERGVKQGRHEEIRTAIREAIRAKFGKGHEVLLRRIERIEGLPSLRAILRAVVTAETVQDVEARIPANGRRPTTRGPRRNRRR